MQRTCCSLNMTVKNCIEKFLKKLIAAQVAHTSATGLFCNQILKKRTKNKKNN